MSKIFYILGGVTAATGVVMAVSGSTFLGAVICAAGLAVCGVTLFATKLIEAGKNGGGEIPSVSDSGNRSVEMKINQAISGARQNKFKAESEIRRLTAWSNDAIFVAYHPEFEKVKANYRKEELLENYGEIREKYGAGLSFEAMEKCDGIVKDYSQKISGYKERMKVFDAQEKEYIVLKDKMKALRQHEKMMNKLEGHTQKLETASGNEAASIVAGDYDMSQLTMESLEKEVSEKELYFKELEKINLELKQ